VSPPGTVLRAGEEIRTLDIFLGKEVLYQLSYARINVGGESRGAPRPTARGFFRKTLAR
jgi:hypothetical protein